MTTRLEKAAEAGLATMRAELDQLRAAADEASRVEQAARLRAMAARQIFADREQDYLQVKHGIVLGRTIMVEGRGRRFVAIELDDEGPRRIRRLRNSDGQPSAKSQYHYGRVWTKVGELGPSDEERDAGMPLHEAF